MTSSSYGQSFAAQLIQAGNYEAAVQEAEKALTTEPDQPEHLADRAQALAELGRWQEALDDFERAFAIDKTSQILETDLLDDAYFSALLEFARQAAKSSVEEGNTILKRYLVIRPEGRHREDARLWQERICGRRKTEFVKRRIDE